MPIHDWTKVDAGLFHAFHHRWIGAICDNLNAGALPADYFALPEQIASGPIPDVLTLRLAQSADAPSSGEGGLAVAVAPPKTRVVQRTEEDLYAGKANRIAVRHRHGAVVAVVEIVSPGNKSSQASLRAFAEKSAEFLRQGIHMLVIDLFPPTKRDPHGIHKVIWEEFLDEPFELPVDKPLTLVSYAAGAVKTAYVEPVGVGDVLPSMPLFLQPERYVPAPLEETYKTAWSVFPTPLKGLLEPRK